MQGIKNDYFTETRMKRINIEKINYLKSILEGMKKIIIAFSGGVDSTFLMKIAKDVLNDNVLAVTAVSETTPRHEYHDAVRLATLLGVPHVIMPTKELNIPEFVANSEDKCYICKKYRFSLLSDMAKERGYDWVVDGSNQDDIGDYRPGRRASQELGIRSPLEEVGMTKADIRLMSKEYGLDTWNKPAYACLATRIPYHSPITSEKLKQVDDAEDFLRSLNISGQIRVRHYGDTARIEMDPLEIVKLTEYPIRHDVIQRFKLLGFKYITVDLEGYRMGSLNKGR